MILGRTNRHGSRLFEEMFLYQRSTVMRCDPNAACLELSNMYQSTCNAGFTPSGDTCVSICSTNEIYVTCTCERCCGKPQVCMSCSTQSQQCHCPNGFYLQGQDCVGQEECNCFTDGNIIPVLWFLMYMKCMRCSSKFSWSTAWRRTSCLNQLPVWL